MKISFGFDVKSINKAVKTLEKAKKDLQGQVITDLLNGCCEWLIRRANEHLDRSDIGSAIKSDIQSAWVTTIIGNIATLTNQSDKAVYVEFGVGIVGQENQHTNANNLGNNYQYNVPSKSKYAGKYHDENTWRFYADDKSEVDLADGFYEEWHTKNGDIKIITRGSPAVMYAFQALVDLKDYGAKQVWEQVKQKYWG